LGPDDTVLEEVSIDTEKVWEISGEFLHTLEDLHQVMDIIKASPGNISLQVLGKEIFVSEEGVEKLKEFIDSKK
jgi:hypothetical protein